MGRKATAHSIGTLKRMDPPHRETSMEVRRMTEGTEMSTVVLWNQVETTGPMPVRYMWWAHTMKLRKPRTTMAQTIDL
jgi:hypothetical protein